MQIHPATPTRRIVVLGTGGTIAGTGDPGGSNLGYTAGTVAVDALLAGVAAPGGVVLQAEQVAQLDSKDMDFATWHRLLQRCVHWLAQPDVGGLVITHGTDTVEETAFFLHSVLSSANPVVLTCAMRPATSLAPDGPQNLRDALAVAATPGASGVVLVCAGAIHDAPHVRKDHPYRVDAFGSGDAGPVGYVEEGEVRLVRPWPQPQARIALQQALARGAAGNWPRVEILASHAGATGRLVDLLVQERLQGAPQAVEGLVLAATGNGMLHREVEEAALRAQAAGITVWRATRCANGRVLPDAGAAIPEAGELSPVKARIALMLVLAGR